MIRANASAATPRPTARHATVRRPFLLALLLVGLFALVATVAVGQRAAADENSRGGDIWVSVDGVAFERGRESDKVSYAVRPVGSRDDGRAFSRELTRDEQNSGWAAFREARAAYPDGYCVVWVEVKDVGDWHETDSTSACNAAEPTAGPAPTPKPTPSTGKGNDKATPVPAPKPKPKPTPAEPVTPTTARTPTSTPTPTPTSTPSPTPSPSVSGTPSPSPSDTSSEGALAQRFPEQPVVRTSAESTSEQDDVISPLGWVAVLGSGTLLTVGGTLLLWRRLT